MKYTCFWAVQIFICTLSNTILAQKEGDTWLFGYKEYLNLSDYTNSVLNFQHDSLQIEAAILPLNFESTSASISDSLGNLLFYTNGCAVYNTSGGILEDGDGLNPGNVREWVCPKKGYIVPKGAMILPKPETPDHYFIFHLGADYEPAQKLKYAQLYVSVIDALMNGGAGGMASKNTLLAEGNFEPFSVVRHGNGKDWWIVMPEFSSNRYFIFLLNSTGVSDPKIQTIGPNFPCKRVGSTAFSPNGLRFARYDGECQAVTFSFDRCTGELSSALILSTPSKLFGGGGVCYSPNGRYLFTTAQQVVYRADLLSAQPKLDTALRVLDMWGTTLNLMQNGPDDRIYISTMSRSDYLHVIETPEALNDIGFVEKGVVLKGVSVRTLPFVPNFRLGKWHENPCDSMVGFKEPKNYHFFVSPNPVQNQVKLAVDPAWTLNGAVQYQLFNALGLLVRKGEVEKGFDSQTIGLYDLPNGVYFFQVMQLGKTLGTVRLIILQR